MNPVRCYREDSGHTIGWACGECNSFQSTHMVGDSEALSQATDCCGPPKCHVCGGLSERRYCVCKACEDARWALKVEERHAEELKLVEKAKTKVNWSDYAGGMFYDGEYHEDFEGFADANIGCLPDHVWGCEKVPFRLDASELIYEALEQKEWFEGAIDCVAPTDLKKLQSFLDEWCASSVPCCYECDDTVCISLEGLAESLVVKDDEEESWLDEPGPGEQ